MISRKLSRNVTAIILTLALWLGALPIGAQQSSVQQQAQTDQAKPQEVAQPSPSKQTGGQSAGAQQGASDKASGEDRKAASATEAQKQRPLSKNEDPRLVGKRNINTGIFAKMSGSLEKEVALGRQLAAEVDREAKFIDDPVITEYINRVGQNLVLHSDAKVPFTIKVIDSDEVNAFALPGGFFYVNKGLILAADNEAELAGVMAHEIAHVAARHTMEQLAKARLAEIGLIAGIFLGIPPIAYDAANLGLGLGFLKFSRSAEEEADRLGAQYLWAAGYDPNALATMFEKLAAKEKKKPGTISRLFSTHPPSVERLQATRELVARFPEREEYILDTSEFQRVKARLMRLSNARVSTAGDIGDKEGSGRPTLKRRPPTTDDSNQNEKKEEQKNEPPKLKRRAPDPNAQNQPDQR
ncbi:M48 family metallopeptidase [Pyrinomonas methylaliphatogenes]|uniref:Peptidase family M48 n=1 Tax=Pyrinomonas methylaliphatogenes TaxID=454194 RepID=A0A0B6X3B2_9BACT|nr:M48 family metallopeptidase [Pyrinomonas methylaliphatogenes]CDM66999.1 Peptidase family M48 [Pyrinomonas methylaliphatogenes]